MDTLRTTKTIAVLMAGLAVTALAGEFPRWRGTDSNGSAGEPGMPLAQSPDEVKLAWVSETLSPHPWNFSVVRGYTAWPRRVLGNGGYCMPAVADGKVYVGYWRPTGTVEAEKGDGKYPAMWVNSGLKSYRLIDADMVIVCMDGRTGTNIWEAVWPGTEMNHVELYGTHNNLCVANGRVYAFGGVGLIYAADAKTGAKLWSAPLGPSAKVWEKFREHCKTEKLKSDGADPKRFGPDAPKHPLGGSVSGVTYNTCVVEAEGVVVSGEWLQDYSLVGFDGATGKELWRQKAGSSLAPPLRWRHGDREYLICATTAIQCLDPKTGKILWTGGELGNMGYNEASVAIEGDLLVSHGRPGAPGTWDGEGWVCYKLSPTGAERVWALGNAYLAGGYVAPVIHRGHVWIPFSRGKDAKGLTEPDAAGDKTPIACVELATGKVVSEVSGPVMNGVCPGLMAMGDLLVYQGDSYLWLMNIADPKKPKFWGVMPMPVNYCSSATAADGFVYFRSGERLVAALDVRKDATSHAQIELTLADALGPNAPAKLHLRGRDGVFQQTWGTCPPKHLCPDPVEPGTLRREGDRVSGMVKAYLEGVVHDYDLDVTLKDGQAVGRYEDKYKGIAVTGDVTGRMRAPALKNAHIGLTWPRHWCNGQNQWHEHGTGIIVRDGKVTEVIFKKRRPDGIQFTAEGHNLVFDGQSLKGTIAVRVPKYTEVKPGLYTVEIDGVVENNRVAGGKVKSTREGAATTTHDLWGGEIEVPETEPVTPQRAVFALDMADSIRFANATSGRMVQRLWITTENGKVVSAVANAVACAGMQKADCSGLRIEGNRVTGKVETWIKADGYVLRADAHSVYELDLTLDGLNVTGSFTGWYDAREMRKGDVTGVCRP